MPKPIKQAAAIPFWNGKICMVTSRSGRRWVLPKGRIEPGTTSCETAMNEAWEEAGLLGAPVGEIVGDYVYEKFERDHHVVVYRMHVKEVREFWPERLVRHRAWVTREEAIARVQEPELKEILRSVEVLTQAQYEEATPL